MALFPASFLDQVRKNTDLVELVGRVVKLKKSGHEYTGLCPFHDEKNPSFTVSPQKNFYHCFGCAAHGNAISFLTDYHGMLFVEAVESLAHKASLPLPIKELKTPTSLARKKHEATLLDVLNQAKKVFASELSSNPQAMNYIKHRGISSEMVSKFSLGYARGNIASAMPDVSNELLIQAGLITVNEGSGEVYDKFRRRLMFPIHNQRGEVIGFGGRVLNDDKPKYMNSPESIVFQKGDELYGLAFAVDAIRRARTVIVLEGYTDVLALHQYGDTRVVASLGTSLSESQIDRLFRLADRQIFCFDGDNAGHKAAERAARNCVRVVKDGKAALFLSLPHGHDPDSYVREYGIDGWRAFCEGHGTPLSAKLTEMLIAGRNIGLPETKAVIAKEAAELLAEMVNAPIFRSAMEAHFENLLGFTFRKPNHPKQQYVTHVSGPVAVAKPETNAQRTYDREHFYRNFALLCAMDGESAVTHISGELLDEFSIAIKDWFASNGGPARFIAAQNIKPPPFKRIVTEAMARVRERYALLSVDAQIHEVDAIIQVIQRDAARRDRAAQALELFN